MSAGTGSRRGAMSWLSGGAGRRARGVTRGGLGSATWALARRTVTICLRYRVTGLASEAGFFALLSLPPLLLGLVGGVGYIGDAVGAHTLGELREQIRIYAEQVFASAAIVQTVTTSIDDVLSRGRLDVISIAFLLSLWSGSRVLNVFIDTISIMYGQGGVRGILRTRALSFSLYVAALVVGAVILPLVLLGPSLLSRLLPDGLHFLIGLYWPVLTLLTVASLASLYHVATPRRSPWRRDVPGAVLALLIWLVASFGLRLVITASVGGTSIYGPLAASIVVLIWLYFLAIAVLIGAALNAATRELWPPTRGGPVAAVRTPGTTLTPVPVPDDAVAARRHRPSRVGERQPHTLAGRRARRVADENQVTAAAPPA